VLGRNTANPRLLSLLFLGFASGLPLALTGSTLQAWFTQVGISVVTIGALSLVGMPYVWKFIWAPVMDRFQLPFFGRRRGWIALTQLVLCLLLFIMANGDPAKNAIGISIVAVLIAFVSASQDIAADAYRTDILSPEERGVGIANYVFAYRMAMISSSGFALIIADRFGWRFTYELMAILMGLSVIPTYFAPEPKKMTEKIESFYSIIISAFKNLLQRDAIILTLLFVVLYKLGDALVVSLTSNFLLRKLEFSLSTVGLAFKTVGLFATIAGAYFGALLLKRLGLYRGLWIFGVAQALSNFMFMVLAIVGKSYGLMVATIFIESFCSGMSTTALLAFLTSLCNQRYSATQYACLSAFASVGRVIVGPFAGIMVEHMGWINFYAWSSLLCFPAILVLTMLRSRVIFNVEAVA
jgi:PAT family beta-lactamase induction signal transducer AmpG